MGDVFALAKELIKMALTEIERLLESPIHETRAGVPRISNETVELVVRLRAA